MGPPPKVVPRLPIAAWRAISSVATTAPTGNPAARAFAVGEDVGRRRRSSRRRSSGRIFRLPTEPRRRSGPCPSRRSGVAEPSGTPARAGPRPPFPGWARRSPPPSSRRSLPRAEPRRHEARTSPEMERGETRTTSRRPRSRRPPPRFSRESRARAPRRSHGLAVRRTRAGVRSRSPRRRCSRRRPGSSPEALPPASLFAARARTSRATAFVWKVISTACRARVSSTRGCA